jgi:hypothetical protein
MNGFSSIGETSNEIVIDYYRLRGGISGTVSGTNTAFASHGASEGLSRQAARGDHPGQTRFAERLSRGLGGRLLSGGFR